MRRFLISLAGMSAAAAISLLISNQVLLNPAGLKPKLRQADVYTAISENLPALLQRGSKPDQSSVDAAVLKRLVTPDYVQSKAEAFLDGLGPYLHGQAPPPAITLADLPARAADLGIVMTPEMQKNLAQFQLTIGQNATKTQPAAGPPAKPLTASLPFIIISAAALAVILTLLAVALSHAGRRLVTIAQVSANAALWTALGGGLWWLAPRVLGTLVLNGQAVPPGLSDALQKVLSVVAQTMGLDLLVAAAVMMAVAGAIWVLTIFHKRRAKSAKAEPIAPASSMVRRGPGWPLQ